MAAKRSAPDFQINKKLKLSDLKNETIVLEWFNKDCPFVKKHYKSNNMQALKKKYKAKGIKWVSIISSASGKQGHLKQTELENFIKKNNFVSDHLVLDESGEIGKAYQAKTTPHMFIIKSNQIIYEGAIDDHPSADPSDIPLSKNYVASTLDALLKTKTVAYSKTKAYGCSVKY